MAVELLKVAKSKNTAIIALSIGLGATLCAAMIDHVRLRDRISKAHKRILER